MRKDISTPNALVHVAVATVCAYEVFAILSNKVDTVSRICRKNPWMTPVILGGLTVHLTPLESLLGDMVAARRPPRFDHT